MGLQKDSSKDKSNKNKDLSMAERYFSDEEKFLRDSLESEEIFRFLTEFEESILHAVHQTSGNIQPTTSDAIRAFQEDLDSLKAESLMKPSQLKPVPEYLLRYVDTNLERPERKQSLIVRLSQKGIQVFDSFALGLNLTPNYAISPDLRSAVASGVPSTSNDAGFVVFEEKIQNGQKFFYQMVRETPQEVFLSIKLDGEEISDTYRQVILRREGRFILSNKLNSEGIVNFSGLLEGAYSVEFIGGVENKVIDLYLILD